MTQKELISLNSVLQMFEYTLYEFKQQLNDKYLCSANTPNLKDKIIKDITSEFVEFCTSNADSLFELGLSLKFVLDTIRFKCEGDYDSLSISPFIKDAEEIKQFLFYFNIASHQMLLNYGLYDKFLNDFGLDLYLGQKVILKSLKGISFRRTEDVEITIEDFIILQSEWTKGAVFIRYNVQIISDDRPLDPDCWGGYTREELKTEKEE